MSLQKDSMSSDKNNENKKDLSIESSLLCTMIKVALFIIFISGTLTGFAQGKEDNVWVLGYNPNDSVAGFGGTMLNFSTDTLEASYFPITIDAGNPGNTAQICSSAGDFLFFSNGCKIVNSTGQLIINGDDINPGSLHDIWCNSGGDHAYKTYQGPIALPWPGHEGRYVMFHLGWYQTTSWPPTRYLRDFYMTTINMTANNGLGEVLNKNTLILQDSNLVDNVTAVRHGNGRDWWLIEPRGLTDSFYFFLLTPYGVNGPYVRKMGMRSNVRGFTAGQVVFSPDGSKYVRVNSVDGIDIFDFDRCSGNLVCVRRLPYPGTSEDNISGVAISPSSRYLYVSALTKMFQYDLWAYDIESSKVLLDVYDGFEDPFPTNFYQQMLAPNGKIYITASNSTQYLHVINSPDSGGVACGFQQHGLRLPTKHGFCVPNFPYFRLYDLPASPCDSIGVDAPEEYQVVWSPTDAIRIFPNPIGYGSVTVTIPPCSGGTLRIFDIKGQFLNQYEVKQRNSFSFNCSGLPNGVYIVTFSNVEVRKPMAARLVICK